MSKMTFQGGLGQQSDSYIYIYIYSYRSSRMAQISKVSFQSPVALALPICAKHGQAAPDGRPRWSWATIRRPR